jgi:hypothetical protein
MLYLILINRIHNKSNILFMDEDSVLHLLKFPKVKYSCILLQVLLYIVNISFKVKFRLLRCLHYCQG